MSRVGSSPIFIPSDVCISLDKDFVFIKGPKGSLLVPQINGINIKVEDNSIILEVSSKSKSLIQKWGLQRSLINNSVSGVVSGYTKQLDIVGVGYRVELIDKKLILKLGFSHDVIFSIPDDVVISVPKSNQIIISGIDKQKVGQVASDIRSYRKPEPYKGKGIKYSNETIVLKQVKKK